MHTFWWSRSSTICSVLLQLVGKQYSLKAVCTLKKERRTKPHHSKKTHMREFQQLQEKWKKGFETAYIRRWKGARWCVHFIKIWLFWNSMLCIWYTTQLEASEVPQGEAWRVFNSSTGSLSLAAKFWTFEETERQLTVYGDWANEKGTTKNQAWKEYMRLQVFWLLPLWETGLPREPWAGDSFNTLNPLSGTLFLSGIPLYALKSKLCILARFFSFPPLWVMHVFVACVCACTCASAPNS